MHTAGCLVAGAGLVPLQRLQSVLGPRPIQLRLQLWLSTAAVLSAAVLRAALPPAAILSAAGLSAACFYQPPAYQQPQYPQQGYAAPCCEPNWWEKLWGARNCCQGGYTQGYAQTGYADGYASTAPARSDSSWSLLSSNNQTYINNSGPLYVSRDGVVTPQAGFGPNYAYAEPAAPGVETYVQPAPRYYRKRYRAYRHGPRVVVRTVYRTRVVYARPKPRMRPHVLVPGNPSTSAGTYEVAPKKVLRP